VLFESLAVHDRLSLRRSNAAAGFAGAMRDR